MKLWKWLLLLLLLGPPVLAQPQPYSFTGTITGTGCVNVPVSNQGTIAFQITGGAWTGTIQPQGKIDGGAAFNIQVTPFQSTSAQNTITANGVYTATIVGLDTVTLCGATVTNTATVSGNAVSVTAKGAGGGGGGAVTSVFARTGDVVANSGDYSVAQVTGAAPIASPTFTGTVTAPALTLSGGSFTGTQCLHEVSGVIGPTGSDCGAGGGAVSSVFTRTGAVVATSGDYTVGQVTGAAPLASPTFTGTVTLPITNATGLVSIAPATTSANGALNVAPTAVGTPSAIFNNPSGSTADILDINLNGVKQDFADLNGTWFMQTANVNVPNAVIAPEAIPSTLYAGAFGIAGSNWWLSPDGVVTVLLPGLSLANAFTAHQSIVNDAAGSPVLKLTAAASQSADSFQLFDSTPTKQVWVDIQTLNATPTWTLHAGAFQATSNWNGQTVESAKNVVPPALAATNAMSFEAGATISTSYHLIQPLAPPTAANQSAVYDACSSTDANGAKICNGSFSTGHTAVVPLQCAAASASGTAYTCATAPTFTPADGDAILFEADVANTGAATLNVNSSSAAPVKKQGGGTALVANDMLAGQDVFLIFDGTNWQMQGQTGNAGGGSGTVTSFSAGNLSPLFTSSVATATTTPALTFSLSTAGANKWLGNNSGSTTSPAYSTIGTADTSTNWYVAGGGTAQAQTATLSPAIPALATGLEVDFLPTAANTAAAPTLAVNGLAAKSITKFGTSALVANDLTTTAVAKVIYDGTEWQLQNPQTNITLSPVTNTTAVTVSNPTANTDTILMDLALSAGYLNTVGQPYLIHASGVLTTTTASVPAVTITAKLCSVSGCGSGTVTPLAAIASAALNTVAISNASWNYDLVATVVANGASCNLIVKGAPGLVIETGSSVATADSLYADSNTAVSSPNQNCANALFLDFFVQQSTTGASNSYKQLSGAIMPPSGFGSGGGGSGTVTSVTFTGDGTVLSSTPSSAVTTSGTLTAALANAAAGTLLGNATGSSAAPTYTIAPVLGVAGTSVGTVGFHNATSGTLTLSPPTGALGTVTVTVPAATDTLVNLAGTQTLTNKSIDAAELNSGTLGTARLGSGTANAHSTLRGDQTWVDAPVSIIQANCTGTVTAAQTNTLLGLGGSASACSNTWATSIGWIATTSYTLKQMMVNLGTTKNTNSYTFTIWQEACTTLTSGACTAWSAAAATAITCSVTATTTGPAQCTDTTHSIVYAIGDIISVKWASVASDSVGNVQLTLEVHQ